LSTGQKVGMPKALNGVTDRHTKVVCDSNKNVTAGIEKYE